MCVLVGTTDSAVKVPWIQDVILLIPGQPWREGDFGHRVIYTTLAIEAGHSASVALTYAGEVKSLSDESRSIDDSCIINKLTNNPRCFGTTRRISCGPDAKWEVNLYRERRKGTKRDLRGYERTKLEIRKRWPADARPRDKKLRACLKELQDSDAGIPFTSFTLEPMSGRRILRFKTVINNTSERLNGRQTEFDLLGAADIRRHIETSITATPNRKCKEYMESVFEDRTTWLPGGTTQYDALVCPRRDAVSVLVTGEEHLSSKISAKVPWLNPSIYDKRFAETVIARMFVPKSSRFHIAFCMYVDPSCEDWDASTHFCHNPKVNAKRNPKGIFD